MPRTDDMRYIVAGSDGLWDNLEMEEIRSAVDLVFDDASLDGTQADIARTVAKTLLQKAVACKKKPDDIAVIVIPLPKGGVVP